VLRHVEPTQRLGNCSTACRTWHAAAAAATSEIDVTVRGGRDDKRINSLMQWLHKRGAAVAQLSIQTSTFNNQAALQLPFAALQQLQHLSLINCQLQQQTGSADDSDPFSQRHRSSSDCLSDGFYSDDSFPAALHQLNHLED
jgi:hypothetical protein